MTSQSFDKHVHERVHQQAHRVSRAGSRNELDSDSLNGHLGYFLRDLQVRVFRDFIRTFAAMKVRPAQYSTLVLIAANPGSSQAAIGKALHIERARFVRLLHDLESRGWTKRVRAPDDRRSHSLLITSEGRKALAKLKALAAQHEQHVNRFVGVRERRTLITLLQKLKQWDSGAYARLPGR